VAGREAPASGELEELIENVGRLADRLQVVGDSLDAIGEDLNWLTRNPLRIEVEAVLVGGRCGVQSIAGDDCCEAERLDASAEASAAVSRVAECLRRTLATITAEQVDALIATLDEAQGHLLQLMRGEVREALHAGRLVAEAAKDACDAADEACEEADEACESESAIEADVETKTPADSARPSTSSGSSGRLF